MFTLLFIRLVCRGTRFTSSHTPWVDSSRNSIGKISTIRLHRVVMLAPPNGGSEVTDFLKETAPYRAFYGPAGQQLGTSRLQSSERLPLARDWILLGS